MCPISSVHPDYTKMEPEWRKAEAFAHSEKVVKDGEDTYVPRLSEQDDDEYAAYLLRASLTMMFKKTVNTYTGMVTKVPSYIFPKDSMEEYLKTCSSEGKSFDDYRFKTLKQYFTTGRCGTLLDLPKGRTNLEPSMIRYGALSIINWEKKMIDGKEELILVVLREWVKQTGGDDIFDQTQERQYRVLTLEDDVYHHRVYDKDLNMLPDHDFVPEMDNNPLTRIPFKIHGGIDVAPLFLSEVLDLNLHHFQLSAGQAHGLHFCGLPTPWVSGVTKKDAPTCIGPTKFVVLEEPEAKVGLLEFQGQGMVPIADKLAVIEKTISALTASSMERSGRVTATQSNIDFANDTASLAGVVNSLSEEFTEVLQIAAKWTGSTEKVSVKFTTDFVSGKISAQELLALTQAYLTGAISHDTYWTNLIHGEVADPHKSSDEEQKEIVIDPDPNKVIAGANNGTGNTKKPPEKKNGDK